MSVFVPPPAHVCPGFVLCLEDVPMCAKQMRPFPKDKSTVNLVSSYMSQIASIPLLSPQEERRLAEGLVQAELEFWQFALALPRGLRTTTEVFETDQDVVDRLTKAYTRAQKDLSRMPKKRALETLSWHCRAQDPDRLFFNQVVLRLSVSASGKHKDPFECNLTKKHRTELVSRFDDVVARRNRFVAANLRLVVSVARDFHHHNLSILDLVQEGNMGLIRAVHRFDPRMGFRFSTYAHWWIRQAIERAILNRGSTIRVPVHVHDARRAVRRAAQALTNELDRAPTYEEIADRVGTTPEKAEQVLTKIPRDPFSLDDTLGSDGDGATLLEIIADENSRGPDDEAIAAIDSHRAMVLLKDFTEMERDIMVRRFGLGGQPLETLESIGESYNLSRERIRQIQARTLSRLREMFEPSTAAS